MKATLVLVFSVAVALFGTSAYAGGWQNNAKVQSIAIEGEADGARVYVIFSGVTNTEGCTGSWTTPNRIYGNTEKGKYLIALIHVAKASNRLIHVAQSGCDDWGRPVINGLWLN